MNKIFIDTNILIDYSKGFSPELKKLLNLQEKNEILLYINPVVIAEYLADKFLEKKEKLREAEEFVRLFTNLDLTREVGIMAGKLLRKQQVVAMSDSLIAATCFKFNLQLYTKNVKDFKATEKLKLFIF